MVLAIDASRANKKQRTGVEWYSYFLIQELKNIIPQDMQVVLYSPSPLESDLLPLPLNWKSRVLRWPFLFWTLKRFSLEMLFNKPDALFVPSHIIPFFSPKRTFTTIHDIGFKRFPECYGFIQRLLLDFGVKRALKKCEKIFVPSEFTKKELMDIYNAPQEKLITTPLASSKSNPTLNIEDVLKKYGVKKPYLFYVGRLETKKNIKNIIAAFNYYSNQDITLVLAGKKGFGCPKTQSLISNIKYLGWIPEEDVRALMSNAKILLYPSLYEGFGIPILEAMASGVPVITSNRASMKEVAGEAALLINPENPNEIKEAIINLLQNNALRTKLIERGLERAKHFSWKQCAQKTWDVMQAQ